MHICIRHLRLNSRELGRDKNDELYFIADVGELGSLEVEYVSYHHRGFSAVSFLSITLPPACGSHFEYILTRGELSAKRFDFPFKVSYMYTFSRGRMRRSIENRRRRNGCLKILAYSPLFYWHPSYPHKFQNDSVTLNKKNIYNNIIIHINRNLFRINILPRYISLIFKKRERDKRRSLRVFQ